MKTISFSSIKGGTGKTSLCILTANYAASASYRVLVADLDLQNSFSRTIWIRPILPSSTTSRPLFTQSAWPRTSSPRPIPALTFWLRLSTS